jgi:predicted RNA-binding Zn ribbon-like protein
MASPMTAPPDPQGATFPAPASESSRGPFELSGGALCLDFANTWADRQRPESDYLRDYAALLAFATQTRTLAPCAAEELARRAAADPAAVEGAMQAAGELRDALYRLFAGCAAGGEAATAAADLRVLNRALADALPHLQVGRRPDGFEWEWRDGEGSLLAPLRPIARSAAELLTAGELVRVRECGGASCSWLFLDTSRNRSRRWCSMESCGNRAKARRHYHRRRDSA